MFKRMGRMAMATVLLLAVLEGPGAARAFAGDEPGTVQLAAYVGPRAVVQTDRPAVTLYPGQSATVMVTVKARVAAGGAVSIDLAAGTAGAKVGYRFLGRTGSLRDAAPLGVVVGSGVHLVPLTLSLAREAAGPVTLPLALSARPEAVLMMAGVTRVAP